MTNGCLFDSVQYKANAIPKPPLSLCGMIKYLPVAWLKAKISLVPRSSGCGRFVKCLSPATSIDANGRGQAVVCGEGN